MTTTALDDPVVRTRDLTVEFPIKSARLGSQRRTVLAVDSVDLAINKGEVLGLVGESGSGKSTLGRALLGLVRASGGQIEIGGSDVTTLSERQWRPVRRNAQMIFQEAHSSLSPRMTVEKLLVSSYKVHRIPESDRLPAARLLESVGLGPEHLRKYPHELSGGQARRVSIARVLALNPKFVVADEITSGLDVSAAAEIIELVRQLARSNDLAFLLISHSVNIVSQIADRVAVMYLGRIVELGSADSVLTEPVHPYSAALLAAIPKPDPSHRPEPPVLGEIPSPTERPDGCRFRTRCEYSVERCELEAPRSESVSELWSVECHRWAEIRAFEADGESRGTS